MYKVGAVVVVKVVFRVGVQLWLRLVSRAVV